MSLLYWCQRDQLIQFPFLSSSPNSLIEGLRDWVPSFTMTNNNSLLTSCLFFRIFLPGVCASIMNLQILGGAKAEIFWNFKSHKVGPYWTDARFKLMLAFVLEDVQRGRRCVTIHREVAAAFRITNGHREPSEIGPDDLQGRWWSPVFCAVQGQQLTLTRVSGQVIGFCGQRPLRWDVTWKGQTKAILLANHLVNKGRRHLSSSLPHYYHYYVLYSLVKKRPIKDCLLFSGDAPLLLTFFCSFLMVAIRVETSAKRRKNMVSQSSEAKCW